VCSNIYAAVAVNRASKPKSTNMQRSRGALDQTQLVIGERERSQIWQSIGDRQLLSVAANVKVRIVQQNVAIGYPLHPRKLFEP
jgi:hypothetical protein